MALFLNAGVTKVFWVAIRWNLDIFIAQPFLKCVLERMLKNMNSDSRPNNVKQV